MGKSECSMAIGSREIVSLVFGVSLAASCARGAVLDLGDRKSVV